MHRACSWTAATTAHLGDGRVQNNKERVHVLLIRVTTAKGRDDCQGDTLFAIYDSKIITDAVAVRCSITILILVHQHRRCTIVVIASSSPSRCTSTVAAPSLWVHRHHTHDVTPPSLPHHHRQCIASVVASAFVVNRLTQRQHQPCN